MVADVVEMALFLSLCEYHSCLTQQSRWQWTGVGHGVCHVACVVIEHMSDENGAAWAVLMLPTW